MASGEALLLAGEAYEDFIALRDELQPGVPILLHEYDRPFPDGRPAEFLKAIKRGPWMKPYLKDARVPPELRRPAMIYLIERFKALVMRLADKHPERFVVVDTNKTLRRKKLWKDELHPTTEGFEAIAKKVYAPLKARYPQFPDWD